MASKRRYNRRALIRDVVFAVAGSTLGYAFAYWLGIPIFSFSSVWLILTLLLLAETVYYVGGSALKERRTLAAQGILPSRAGSPDFDVRTGIRGPRERRIYRWAPGEDLARSVLLLAIALIALDLWFAFTRPSAWPLWVRLFIELPTVILTIWLRFRRSRYLTLMGRRRSVQTASPPRTRVR